MNKYEFIGRFFCEDDIGYGAAQLITNVAMIFKRDLNPWSFGLVGGRSYTK